MILERLSAAEAKRAAHPTAPRPNIATVSEALGLRMLKMQPALREGGGAVSFAALGEGELEHEPRLQTASEWGQSN